MLDSMIHVDGKALHLCFNLHARQWEYVPAGQCYPQDMHYLPAFEAARMNGNPVVQWDSRGFGAFTITGRHACGHMLVFSGTAAGAPEAHKAAQMMGQDKCQECGGPNPLEALGIARGLCA